MLATLSVLALNGFFQTLVIKSPSLLADILSISAENVGLAGIIGDRQQTLVGIKQSDWFIGIGIQHQLQIYILTN